MIGLVLVSHGRLADEFRDALEHVMGAQAQTETVSIGPADDMDARRADIADAARRVDSGAGVIICTDMFGGTPSNLALAAMGASERPGTVEVLAGMNLPMLVKLAGVRAREALPRCALIGQSAGREYIKVASVMLGRRDVRAAPDAPPATTGASPSSAEVGR